MRKIPLFLFIALTLLLAACRGAATPTPTRTPTPAASPSPTATPPPTFQPTATVTVTPTPIMVSVTIRNSAFVPAQLTVERGTQVTWTNQDSLPHTVTGTGFDSGNLNQGQSFSYIFTTAGDYTYSCSLHPTMRGQVTVK